MKYSVGDKIIFNKNYRLIINEVGVNYCITVSSKGWVEPWLIGRIATITRKEKISSISEEAYYIDIPNTHGYYEGLFSKLELLVEA